MQIIVDVEISDTARAEFSTLGLCLHYLSDITQVFVARKEWDNFHPDTTLLVFVGNGGSKVKNLLPRAWTSRWLWKADAFAKRFWEPGMHPYAIAHRFARGVYVGISDVVLIDDVVSSGVTARRVQAVNVPWVPNAHWHLATLIAQRSASLRGYRSSFSVIDVGTMQHKVPINSLSALIADSCMAKVYAERNLSEKAQVFLRLLESVECHLDQP